MRACGAFLLKVHEMQRTIDTLVTDMKLFHSWIIFTILRLSHQEIPEGMNFTDKENVALAEFFCGMEPELPDQCEGGEKCGVTSAGTEDSSGEGISQSPMLTQRSKFNLERVGQYLENTYLTQLQPISTSEIWKCITAQNECMAQCTQFVPHDKKLSLVQQRDKMFNAIDAVFHKPTESISSSFKLTTAVICGELPDCLVELSLQRDSLEQPEYDFVNCTYHVDEATKCDMLAITISWQEVMILEFSRSDDCLLRCTRVKLTPGPLTPHLHEDYYNLRFVDLQFYNESSLSMLAQTSVPTPGVRPHSYFVQFSLSAARYHSTQHLITPLIKLPNATVTHSIHDIVDAVSLKALDGVCEMLAVSGSRKVATVLSDRRRKMTIFEMEIEEEEDDTEMSQASFLDISKESVLANSALESDKIET